MKKFYIAAALLMSIASSALAQNATLPDGTPDYATKRLGDETRGPKSSTLQRCLIPAGLLYASFDTDGDYAASRSELDAGILRSFASADVNSNGTLSLVELANWRGAVLGSQDLLPGNTQFDKNFDNQIDPSEFKMALTDIFEGFDENDNDQLEFSEMTRDMPQPRRSNSQRRERPSVGQRQGQKRLRGQ